MDWFSELMKYRQTEYKTPRENFLSAAFAGVLSADAELCHGVLQRMFIPHVLTNPEIEVQKKIGDGATPDILITTYGVDEEPTFVGAIECKVDAEPDESQILEYQRVLRQKYPTVRTEVVFLGKYPKPQFKKFPNDKVFTWAEVSEFLQPGSNTSANYLRKELIKLMGNLGLLPPKQITRKWLSVLPAYYQTVDSIGKQLLSIAERFVKDGLLSGDIKFESGIRSWYCGVSLRTRQGTVIGLYLVWWSEKPFGLAVNVYEPETVIKSLTGRSVSFADGRSVSFQERLWTWGGIGCHLPFHEESDEAFWSLSVEEQTDYVYDKFRLILQQVHLI